MTQDQRRRQLLRALIDELPAAERMKIPESPRAQERLLRGLVNVRPPTPISDDFLQIQDAYLQELLRERGVVDARALDYNDEGLAIWQGDISRLAIDAIVNAANSGMTGCYIPNHACIDNVIHSYAGVQLRLACEEQMAAQGHPEPTGQAKITPAFNLPACYVIHTVGPIVHGSLTHAHEEALARSYHACLQLAAERGLESIAFCCISTGVFRFPNEAAARIALDSVCGFLQEDSSIKKVVFNVFKDLDYDIYRQLFR